MLQDGDGNHRVPGREDVELRLLLLGLRGVVPVRGSRLYTLARVPTLQSRLLELHFSPGVEAYAFTFG